MKTIRLALTTIALGAQIACSSGSGSAASVATNACVNAGGQSATCSELVAANSGSQVVAKGAAPTNVAQVPDTSVVAAQAIRPSGINDPQGQAKIDPQVQAKLEQLRSQSARMSANQNTQVMD